MPTAFVQGVSSVYGGAATSFAVAYGSNNAAGDCLIALVSGAGLTGLAIADTQLNSWVNIFTDSATLGTSNVTAAWYALNSKAGANTVTVSWTSSTAASAVCIAEYSGVATSSAVDQNNGSTNQTASTSWTTPTLTTTGNNELLVAFNVSANGAEVTSAPFTQRQTITSAGTVFAAISDDVNQPIGAYHASGTQNSGVWAAWLTTFFSSNLAGWPNPEWSSSTVGPSYAI